MEICLGKSHPAFSIENYRGGKRVEPETVPELETPVYHDNQLMCADFIDKFFDPQFIDFFIAILVHRDNHDVTVTPEFFVQESELLLAPHAPGGPKGDKQYLTRILFQLEGLSVDVLQSGVSHVGTWLHRYAVGICKRGKDYQRTEKVDEVRSEFQVGPGSIQ